MKERASRKRKREDPFRHPYQQIVVAEPLFYVFVVSDADADADLALGAPRTCEVGAVGERGKDP